MAQWQLIGRTLKKDPLCEDFDSCSMKEYNTNILWFAKGCEMSVGHYILY
jgi:hypothetical protein